MKLNLISPPKPPATSFSLLIIPSLTHFVCVLVRRRRTLQPGLDLDHETTIEARSSVESSGKIIQVDPTSFQAEFGTSFVITVLAKKAQKISVSLTLGKYKGLARSPSFSVRCCFSVLSATLFACKV